MVMRLTGVIRGRQIELDRDTGLADGATVDVRIEHPSRPVDKLRRRVDALCGAWSDDDSVEAVFEEIERARLAHASPGTRLSLANLL